MFKSGSSNPAMRPARFWPNQEERKRFSGYVYADGSISNVPKRKFIDPTNNVTEFATNANRISVKPGLLLELSQVSNLPPKACEEWLRRLVGIMIWNNSITYTELVNNIVLVDLAHNFMRSRVLIEELKKINMIFESSHGLEFDIQCFSEYLFCNES